MTWYVVNTQPNSEEKARLNLARQGFRPYLPRYKKFITHARRRELVKRPLFPGYLFVDMDVELCAWRKINSTFGVYGLITQDNRPAAIPNAVVEEIQAHENDEGVIQLPAPRFQPGEPLRIEAGPFVDQSGLFDCFDDNDRVTVLLALMGRQVKIHVPQDHVTAIA